MEAGFSVLKEIEEIRRKLRAGQFHYSKRLSSGNQVDG